MKNLYKLTLDVEGWTPNIVTEYCWNENEQKAQKCVLNSLVYKNKTKIIKVEAIEYKS